MKLKFPLFLILLVLCLFGLIYGLHSGWLSSNEVDKTGTDQIVVQEKYLLPDLSISDPSNIYIEYKQGEKNLRFDTSFINEGESELRIVSEINTESELVLAKQIIKSLSGEEKIEKIGEFVYHPTHEHWHIEGFARYQLWTLLDEGQGDLVVSQDKVSFCLFDYEKHDIDIENAPKDKVFINCNSKIQGISVGWKDTYHSYFDGQSLDVSQVEDGRYILKTIINAEGNILEEDYSNNESVVVIEILGDSVNIINNSQENNSDLSKRVSKKSFGDYIDVNNSPVENERFKGFHTGADYEFEDTENDVPVYALGDGELVLRRWVNGYGGTIVLRTVLEDEEVYVLYGHLDLEGQNINKEVKKGEKLAVLGQGYTHDTDFGRKHLHLAIAKHDIKLKGYTLDEDELIKWIDPLSIVGLSELVFGRI